MCGGNRGEREMKRKSSMRSPRNRQFDRSNFEASYGEIMASQKEIGRTASVDLGNGDACKRRKRVRFEKGTDCSLESDSDVVVKLNADLEADVPKTSEYAFFRKIRRDVVGKAGLSRDKENNRTNECQSSDCSDAGVGNIVRQSFRALKSLMHPEDVRHTESSPHLSPLTGPSKATDVNYPEQLDFRKPELSHPVKKAMHVNFEIPSSPFRDPVRRAAANYVYGQGNIFSTKRDKLLQLVANTYPESKDLDLSGANLVNSMLGRLFPKGYVSKHDHRPPKLRLQDSCRSMSPGFPEHKADSEEFHWSGNHSLRESGDLMLMDDSFKSSGSTKLSKWGVDYSLSPEWENDFIHFIMKEPCHSSDYGRSRSPLKKYLTSCLPRETFKSHTSSDVDSHHPNDITSRKKLLLGWVDEKTEDKDQLQIAPYNFDYGRSLHSNCQSLRKNDYSFGSNTNCELRLSSYPPQFFSGHYGNSNNYFQTLEETDDCVASGHLLEDGENKKWDIIHSNSSGSYFATTDDDFKLPCTNHSLLSTSDSIPQQELLHSNYSKGQLTCIDQSWEVCGKEVTCSHYKRNNYNIVGAYQIGYDEPSTDDTPYHRLPYAFDEENALERSIDHPADHHKCDGDMIFITSKIQSIQSPPAFCGDSFLL